MMATTFTTSMNHANMLNGLPAKPNEDLLRKPYWRQGRHEAHDWL